MLLEARIILLILVQVSSSYRRWSSEHFLRHHVY